MFLTLSLKVAKFQAVRNKAHVNAFSDIAAPRRLHAPRLSGKGAARCRRNGTVKKGGTIGKVKSNVSNSKKKPVFYTQAYKTPVIRHTFNCGRRQRRRGRSVTMGTIISSIDRPPCWKVS